MPGGNGTGRGGNGTGRGMGMGKSQGQGQGQGQGRMGGFSLGAGGTCVCPSCGKTAAHQRGMSCTQIKCPNCGSNMTRNQ